LVSLPFSDHCEPLVSDEEELHELLFKIGESLGHVFKYAEIRPKGLQLGSGDGFQPYARYYRHTIDLGVSRSSLYSSLSKDSVQRKIRRAQREGLLVEQGQSQVLLKEFYHLQLLTRQRHGVPPQPFAWFRNLVECFGPRLTIYVARAQGRPVASILTLRHKSTVVYKYGCSDIAFHRLGGMPFLFWHVIQEAKDEGLQELDLGRSDIHGVGLIRFKQHLGAQSAPLYYWRQPLQACSTNSQSRRAAIAQRLVCRLPRGLFRLAGELLYRHAG